MLQFEEYKVKLNNLKPQLEELYESLGLERAKREVEELEIKSSQPGFWDNPEESQKIVSRMGALKGKIEAYNRLSSLCDDLLTICEMAIEENDAIAMDISILKVSDEYTFRHSVDVAAMGMIVARKAGMSSREIRELGLAGLLHDIGKSKIPPELLNKTGRLSDEEYSIMKKHPFLGYQLLKEKKDIPRSVKLAVLQHHEKISGKGYPFGIKGDQINSYSKIISITDIYDALVTERPYKKAFSQRDAVEMIMAMTDDLDVSAMRSFLGSVILYPVGSTVSLNNGERARVVKNTPGYPLRPKVIGLKTGRVYDLSEDIRCASVIIE